MDLSYSNINLFPSAIHKIDVKGFDEIQHKLIDYAYDLKKKDPEGVKLSNQGGWQSSPFKLQNEDDVLHYFLINCLKGFPPIQKSFSINVGAWININKLGDYNMKHNHPTVDLSGVLWIKCLKDCGDIVFENPTVFQSYNEIDSYIDDFKNRNNIYQSYYFSPLEGRMLIFPSHLQHHVEENESNEDRISVSFNIKLTDIQNPRQYVI